VRAKKSYYCSSLQPRRLEIEDEGFEYIQDDAFCYVFKSWRLDGGGIICQGAVNIVAFAILLIFIVRAHLLEVTLAPQDMRKRDPVLFFFEACMAMLFVAVSSLKKIFL